MNTRMAAPPAGTDTGNRNGDRNRHRATADRPGTAARPRGPRRGAADDTLAHVHPFVARSRADEPADVAATGGRTGAMARPLRRSSPPTARGVAHLGPEARMLRTDVAAWALAHAEPLDYDALTVILAAKEALPEGLRTWRDEDVWRLWWLDLARWCSWHGVAVPAAMGPTLLALFHHLDATAGFGPHSDDLDDLEDALHSAGARVAVSPSRHPSSS